MAGSKDHTDISPDNILKTAVENLTADEQQQYEDYTAKRRRNSCRNTRWIATRRLSNMERPTSHLFYLRFKSPM
jgi:hypothetical protein